jgi:thiol-disulfide isomerase/thioredoxin
MRNFLVIICLVFIFISCANEKQSKTALLPDPIPIEVFAVGEKQIPYYGFNELHTFFKKQDDKIYVINFWATWCKPCIEELPYFEELQSNYKDKNVRVLLVSLDFPRMIKTNLLPYIEEHNLQSEVLILNDVKSNEWIPKIDKDWSGAIPATYIYNKDKSAFYEGSFSYAELETEVKQFIN